MPSKLDTPLTYLKGVGPKKAELLQKELGLHTWRDLLYHYPFRYVDKTRFTPIRALHADSGEVLLRGVLRRLETVGTGPKKRMIGRLRDHTGVVELVWFKGLQWLEKSLVVGQEYVVFGRVHTFQGKLNIPHPEMEPLRPDNAEAMRTMAPVYPSTDKLNQRRLDQRERRRIVQHLLSQLTIEDVPEVLPPALTARFNFPTRLAAFRQIHFPRNEEELEAARRRLKFEELFFMQLRLLQLKHLRKRRLKGYVFEKVGDRFLQCYHHKLPFELTEAQKRVMREIRRDLGSGTQMNRLLQGDVGSGKTIVALLSMLLAIDNGFQACLMAPTEVLARQHYHSICNYLEGMDVEVAFLSGNVKGKSRRTILEGLRTGRIHIAIGTHALIEPQVAFHRLGLAITDEQHRFGVRQRAALWKKNKDVPPHILVMTATPIPRTLAMTLYGDLDLSIIDELPPGRKPVTTLHRTERQRDGVYDFMRQQIAQGRQVYVVYPLIEESEKLDLLNLEQGYEALRRSFPPPQYQISVVHGRMKPADKEFEMQRFVRGETQIMVATTVIEVGVNVPNATVMLIEHAERFGLSQLHQLRGRVGRGAEQSYCILMTGYKLTQESRQRIRIMCQTQDGFKIAEMDLRLRGPGNMEGTQQSGILQLRLADLSQDGPLLQQARKAAAAILAEDPELALPPHLPLRRHLAQESRNYKSWGLIS